MHERELHRWQHDHAFGTQVRTRGEQRTRWVVAITLAMMAVEVETPEEYAGGVMGDLSSRRGLVQGMDEMPGGGKIIKAEVPLSEMFGYSTTLRSMSQGRATYTMEFKHYAEAPRHVADAIISSRTK